MSVLSPSRSSQHVSALFPSRLSQHVSASERLSRNHRQPKSRPRPGSPDTPKLASTRSTRCCSQVGLEWSAKESEGSYSYAGVPCGVKNRAMTTSPPRTISTTVPEGCSHATYRGSSTSTRKGVPQARVPASS